MLVSLKFPQLGFALVCCAVLLYLQPEPPRLRKESADPVEQTSEVVAQRETDPSTANQHSARKPLETPSKE